MAKKNNYHELTEQEKETYRFAVVNIVLNNEREKRIMHGSQVNGFALEVVHAVNITIDFNEPIVNLDKEMD